MRGALKAWSWYAAGAVTVLLGIWLYTRRLYLGLERSAAELGEQQ